MKSRFKMVMLPSNQKAQLSLNKNGKLLYCKDYLLDWFDGDQNHTTQHLYIVDTQANIQVGDWVIAFNKIPTFVKDEGWLKQTYHNFKIIATTNTELTSNNYNDVNRLEDIDGLPTIPDKLVQEYIQNPSRYIDFDKWVVSSEKVESKSLFKF